MPSFDMVVVGCGGGPLETNLSSYLFKDAKSDWEAGIIGLEAGSGLGALTALLSDQPDLFGKLGKAARPSLAAANIMTRVHTYLVTHAHMDHILGVVISAGSLKGERKKVVATKSILAFIESVFQDGIWPKLASYDVTDPPHNYLLTTIQCDGQYHKMAPNILVRSMPLSHGRTTTGQDYPSLAFFVRNKATNCEFLFFGDVEPDSISGNGTTRDVWRAAAPLIVGGSLLAIFLECSWPSGRSDDTLFGHLTLEYFVEELRNLGKEVGLCREAKASGRSYEGRDLQRPPPPKRRRSTANVTDPFDTPLLGVKVYVTHFKEPTEETKDPRPISQIITDQINSLAKSDLGAEIVAAEQGMRISI